MDDYSRYQFVRNALEDLVKAVGSDFERGNVYISKQYAENINRNLEHSKEMLKMTDHS